jgi:hypothetical protein
MIAQASALHFSCGSGMAQEGPTPWKTPTRYKAQVHCSMIILILKDTLKLRERGSVDSIGFPKSFPSLGIRRLLPWISGLHQLDLAPKSYQVLLMKGSKCPINSPLGYSEGNTSLQEHSAAFIRCKPACHCMQFLKKPWAQLRCKLILDV